jgi:CheY-like chemotaxis protein
VAVAENGADALVMAQRERFDLILMDCQMPVMDGFEASRSIRAAEREAGSAPIPIVALTANALSGDREACIAAGMTDYLSKPVTRARLSETLHRCLAAVAGNAPATAVPVADPDLEAALSVAFDPTVVQSLPMVADGSNPEFADQLLGIYVENAAKLLDAFEQAARSGDAQTMLRSAHTLKSSSATVGAMALSNQARELEELMRGGSNPMAGWPELLRNEYVRFEVAFAQHRGSVAAPVS